MLAITLALLAVGSLLAALGTAGFAITIHQPASGHELESARKAATLGRWMAAPGLLLYGAHHGAPAGPGLYALMLIAALTVATFITKSTTRPPARGGRPQTPPAG